MIISVENFESFDGDFSVPMVDACVNFALAFTEKNHIIYGTRKSLEKLSEKLAGKNLKASQAFNEIKNKMTQIGGLVKQSEILIKIDFSTDILNEKQNFLSAREIIVPYSFFVRSSSIQKTTLLCENSDDASFYKKLAEVFRLKNSYTQCLNISLEGRMGGGNTTHSEYEKLLNEKEKFCYCIVDTDKKHPKCKLGSTAEKFKKDHVGPITRYEILDCHEIEVLIPFKLLCKDDNQLDKDQIETIDYLCELEAKNFDDTKFLDLKKGYSLKEIMSYDEKHNDSYWLNIIKREKPKKIKTECLSATECLNSSKGQSCTCQVIHSLGNNILRKTLEYLKKNSLHEFVKLYGKTSSQKLDFVTALGARIFWWGCSPLGEKKRT